MIKRLNVIFKGNERSVVVKKNIAASFVIKGFSILISLMLVPATIGYVSAELYGVWLALASVLQWIQFLDLGITLGLKNKLTEAIAIDDWDKAKSLVSTAYIMVALVFIPAGIIMEFLVPTIDWCTLLNISSIYSNDIRLALYALIAFVCLQMIVNVISVILSAFQRVAFSSLFMVIGQALAFVLIVVLTKTTPPSLMGLALSYSAIPVLVTIFATIWLFLYKYNRIAPSIRCFDKTLVKELLALGYKFFIINVQVVVLYQSTNILISNVSSPLQVTAYNIAYKYLNVAMMVYALITAPLWPAYTDAYVKNDFTWMKNTYHKMVKILLLSFLACVLMVIISPLVYSLWIGDKAEIPMLMTVLVALYVMAYGWMNVNGTLIVGMGILHIDLLIAIVGMLIHIPLSLSLSKITGAYGVIISMIVINVFYAVILNIQLNKILHGRAKGIWLKR